jgi:hypothetical protein
VFAMIISSVGALSAPNRSQVLQAIAQIESGGDYSKPGPSGEVGPYQMMPSTWRDYSNNSPSIARTKEGQVEAIRVAEAHYNQIVKFLDKNNRVVNAYNIALCWNAGTGNFKRGTYSTRHKDYAGRVLYILYDCSK